MISQWSDIILFSTWNDEISIVFSYKFVQSF